MFNEKKYLLIIAVYVPDRFYSFLKSFYNFNPGIEYDMLYVYNYYDKDEYNNRWIIEDCHKKCLLETILNDINSHSNHKLILRENIGEDLGAYREGYLRYKNQYKYIFFINEASIIKNNNWLKIFYDIFENNENFALLAPQIFHGHQYKYAVKSTFFSIKTKCFQEFIWHEPFNRNDAQLQEMELFYPFVKNQNLICGQVGIGNEYLSYVKNGSETTDIPSTFNLNKGMQDQGVYFGV